MKDPFTKIAEQTASIHFDAGYCANDPEQRRLEGMGIALGNWTGHAGRDILIVARVALEDANFHGEAAVVEDLLKRI